MKIRIAINESYGGNYLPKFIKNQIDKDKNFRIEVARILDSLEVNGTETLTCYEDLGRSNESYLKFDNEKVVFYNKELKSGTVWRLCEVDTDIPWKISDYDGCESIETFGGVKVINKETGEAEW